MNDEQTKKGGSKWNSRKLFVTIIAVIAAAWSIHTGNPEVEGTIVEQGNLLATVAVSLVSAIYVIVQGRIDRDGK